MEIIIENSPDKSRLNSLNVFNWPIWSKEISEFPWGYDTQETCYFIEGEVIVTLSIKEQLFPLLTVTT